MTVKRKLQYIEVNKIYQCTMPKAIVEALGWKKGDKLRFDINGKRVIITPEANSPAKMVTPGDHTQPLRSGGND